MKEWTIEADPDLRSSPTSAPLADFLWVTRPNPPEQEKPRIGIFLKQKGESQGLWIERVVPGGPAEKAGLLAGDQLIAVEGKEISEVTEIHDALSRKGWGKEISLTLIREGSKKEITVTLPSQKD
jgi:S1-C subfamily serine protease